MDYNQYQNQNQNAEFELDWEGSIEKELEFIVLPEGDYPFKVESFTRSRFNGSDKMPACNMAVLKIRVDGPNDQSTLITHRLFLHSRTEWKLSEFFRSIGQKKENERIQMNWNLVAGSRGMCKLGKRVYNGNEYNEIQKFYPAENNQTVQGQGQPQGGYGGYNQGPQGPGGFTPGSF